MHVDDFLDLPFGETASPQPGLLVERRGLLATAAAALAAAGLPGASPSWRHRGRGDDFTIEEFVRTVTPVCKELLADTGAKGQDRYLQTLASVAVRLTDVPVPDNMRQTGPGHTIGSNHGPDPFTVLHWQLEPGVVIEPHAHTYGNVVTLGLAGWALVRNYEVLGDRTFEAAVPCRVQRTVEQVLRPGDINLVSLERNYVHGFQAGKDGARGLDITTRIRPRSPAPVLQLGECVDDAARTFAATWRIA